MRPSVSSVAGAPLPGVAIVHAAVPGRVRCAVRGLRHNAPLAARIERHLGDRAGIRAVQASTLTGRVLVHFCAPWDAGRIVAAITACVDGDTAPGAAASRPRVTAAAPWPALLATWRRQLGVRVHARRDDAPPAALPVHATPAWHIHDAEALLAQFGSSRHDGLDDDTVSTLRARHGPNRLPDTARRGDLAILMDQFRTLPTALLGGSALLALATGGIAEPAITLLVVVVNAGIGFLLEAESERTFASLAGEGRHSALVIRAAKLARVDVEDLVPGDLLVLQPGQTVGADARLLDSRTLAIDESALSGESLPVTKQAVTLADPALPLAERINMAHMGTVVTGGSGLAMVVATGRATELGAIQRMVGGARAPRTPLQNQLTQLGNQLVWLSLAICGLTFGLGLLRGQGLVPMLRSALSLAVAAVPEGLPTVATTTLALGMRRMRRHRVLVRQLDAVETLGAVQVLCLDKTGTLTQNRMAVLALHGDDEAGAQAGAALTAQAGDVDGAPPPPLCRLLEVAVLCSDVAIDDTARGPRLEGSATECALVECALAHGLDASALRAAWPRREVLYRAEDRHWMATLHAGNTGERLAVKGSPTEVLALCTAQATAAGPVPLDDDRRRAILRENARMGGEALRVLGFASREQASGAGLAVRELTWLGLAGLADPLRDGTRELIADFHGAGIRTVMITGDQSGTAQAIGRALDLSGNGSLELLDSTDLAQVEPHLLAGLAERADVFSRVSPAHKLEIVRALQQAGRVVAMTGDGVNDSPALKAADIGIAMGASGTAVARAVADVVLTDDALQTLVVALREGRTITRNIRKSVHFLTSTNLAEIGLMLGAAAIGLPPPLGPLQILWINLLTDTLPALALAVEAPEDDVLRSSPRDPATPLIGRDDLVRHGIEALSLTAGTLGAYAFGVMRHGPGPRAGALAFHTMVVAQLLHAYTCRAGQGRTRGVTGTPRNPRLDLALATTALLQAATLAPPLRGLLGSALPGPAALVALAAGAGLPYLFNMMRTASPDRAGKLS